MGTYGSMQDTHKYLCGLEGKTMGEKCGCWLPKILYLGTYLIGIWRLSQL